MRGDADGSIERSVIVPEVEVCKTIANAIHPRIDVPTGFDRAGSALEDYAFAASKAYRNIADTLNDPSLRGEVDMIRSISVTTAYAKTAIDAFESDLEHAPFTHREKQRLIDKLLHG